MYYWFTPLLFSCCNIPLFLLLISLSAFSLSDLCLQNTSSAYFIQYFTFTRSEQYSNTSPSCCGVIVFAVPFPLFILVFQITSPAHKVFYFTPHCNNVAGESCSLLLFTFIPKIASHGSYNEMLLTTNKRWNYVITLPPAAREDALLVLLLSPMHRQCCH